MIQFTSHTALLLACRNFNLLLKGFCFEPKKYYRYEKDRVFTKEFKIMNVEKTILNEELYMALDNICRRGNVYIRTRKMYKPNRLYGDIMFMLTDD